MIKINELNVLVEKIKQSISVRFYFYVIELKALNYLAPVMQSTKTGSSLKLNAIISKLNISYFAFTLFKFIALPNKLKSTS